MPQPDSIPVLNWLMAVLCRSLPQYLTDARPYTVPGNDDAVETLAQIAADSPAIVWKNDKNATLQEETRPPMGQALAKTGSSQDGGCCSF